MTVMFLPRQVISKLIYFLDISNAWDSFKVVYFNFFLVPLVYIVNFLIILFYFNIARESTAECK
jgi:hypothetical protein